MTATAASLQREGDRLRFSGTLDRSAATALWPQALASGCVTGFWSTSAGKCLPGIGAALAGQMQACLRERFAPSALEVLDESWQHEGHAGANGTGFGTHFRVRITAAALAGLPRVARHRLVYDALQDFIDRQGVHALAIEATG